MKLGGTQGRTAFHRSNPTWRATASNPHSAKVVCSIRNTGSPWQLNCVPHGAPALSANNAHRRRYRAAKARKLRRSPAIASAVDMKGARARR